MFEKLPINNRSETKYIQLNTKKCEACWKCVESCKQNVFSRIDFLWHRHAKIKNPDNCTGCLNCAKVCEFNAIKIKTEINYSF